VTQGPPVEKEIPKSSPQPASTLAERSFSALKWNYLGALVRVVSQLVIGVLLARLLGPEPFGLVAIAWFVVGLGNLISDLGFGSALIQRERIHEEDTRFVFTILVLIASIMTITVVSTAGFVSDFFRRPDAVPVIRALGLLFVAQAFGQVPANLLRRELNFKVVQMAQVSSYLIAYLGLGIPLAIAGAGVWSLVAAALAQAVLVSTMLFAMRPHAVAPLLSQPGRGLLGFGSTVMGSNIANFTINNIDTAIIGRAFGAVDLGLYSRALQLVSTPMNAVLSNLSAVLFPAYSRAQANTASVRKTYFASLTLVGLLCLPVFTAIAVVPETVIIGLYGSRWSAAVPLLAPLSLGIAVTGLLALSGPLLMGVGRPGVEFRAQALSAVVTVLALILAAAYSLVVLAWTLFGVFLIRFYLVTRNALQATTGTWSDVLRALISPMTVAAFIAAAVKGVDLVAVTAQMTAGLRLMLAAFVGAASLLTSLVVLRRWLFSGDVAWFVNSIQGRLPGIVTRVLLDKPDGR
jgi:O-antigen/teichoic acid export membrane protein